MTAPATSARLILQFDGWCQIRLPTDPDPTDEPRGASGYTFAFAGEPDLDRIVRLQPSDTVPVRSHGWPIGVSVRDAFRQEAGVNHEIPGLVGASVELLGEPRLENRNWTLTPAGYEPIVPFDLQIANEELRIRRRAPLDPAHPDAPLWALEPNLLQAQGANGVEFEPETVGRATGIWDSLQIAKERLARLRGDLEMVTTVPDGTPEQTALRARISELEIGIGDPTDRRIVARYYVERFGFDMLGDSRIDGNQTGVLGGTLAEGAEHPWSVRFWIGAWDPDVLSAYFEGVLDVPFETVAAD